MHYSEYITRGAVRDGLTDASPEVRQMSPERPWIVAFPRKPRPPIFHALSRPKWKHPVGVLSRDFHIVHGYQDSFTWIPDWLGSEMDPILLRKFRFTFISASRRWRFGRRTVIIYIFLDKNSITILEFKDESMRILRQKLKFQVDDRSKVLVVNVRFRLMIILELY